MTSRSPRHLIDELVPGKCPSLSGKPKMIFVQACQGQKTDVGSDVRVRSRHTSHDGAGGGTNNWYRIPHYADFLVFQVKLFLIFFRENIGKFIFLKKSLLSTSIGLLL